MIPSQMLKGVLEGCILAVIREEETYGYEITTKLEGYGFGSVAEGTIYPILLRLEKNGSIVAEAKPSPAGPKRKYYHLTETGQKSLEEFCRNWQAISEAVNSVLYD
ncbi:lineage-specific thermal regulator protein [uncultured Eubacterium sp.]|uniref:PadR family transcriptional regulator n=1 Tax=Emergencia sp. TaxID=1926557 RepID=UPI000820E64A|nr:lineage-specific thermal regulator protein [uncultured Eubacterium sp.]